MSWFKRIGASLGLGGATVETALNQTEYAPGDTVKGVATVKGGTVDQQIGDIDLHLFTRYQVKKDDKRYDETVKLGSYRITEGFTIAAKEERRFPFSFVLPLDTPITFGKTKVWIKTDVDIEQGVDTQDNDVLRVIPHPYTAAVLEAVEDIGFRLYQADCEYAPRFRRRLPFVQEFEFAPTNSRYRGRLDEVEVICHPEPDGIEVFIEIDRRARGLFGFLEEAAGMDESLVRVRFSRADLQAGRGHLSNQLEQIIQRYARL